MSKFEEWEINKYWEIFSGLDPNNGILTGDQVAIVLKNSQLPDSELERVWDLSDINKDGNLDFEEFCIAMRLIFDRINGKTSTVPSQLPEWLVPASKAHLVEANRAVQTNSLGLTRITSNDSSDDDAMLLSSDFDWYISPSDRDNYSKIYTANADYHGLISFDSLTELYSTLPNIPETDLRSAWNMVNPRSNEKIDKDQCIVFLHILHNRSRGVRLPRAVPASLRATFEKARPEYDLNSRQAQVNRPSLSSESDDSAPSSSRAKFGESYLSRLGIGSSGSSYSPSGTDFSSTNSTDWDEVRLKRKLADLEKQLENAEAAADRRRRGLEDYGSSHTGLIKRELEQLLDYKEKLLLVAQRGSSGSANGASDGGPSSLQQTREEVDMIASQVAQLKSHVEQKESELKSLRAQLAK